MIALALPFIAILGVAAVCKALGMARATWYRAQERTDRANGETPAPPQEVTPRRSHRRLTDAEEARILDALHEPRFADKAPAEVYATLLDEGTYVGSIRTYYRVLAKHQEVKERRAICSHPNYRKPELLARGPNELVVGHRGTSTSTTTCSPTCRLDGRV
jgi:putative transposase